MNITVPDDKARALLAELSGLQKPTTEDLKAKLRAGLTREKQLAAVEIETVLAVLDSVNIVSVPPPAGVSHDDFLTRWRAAQAKLRTLLAQQQDRERREGRS